MNWNLLLPYIPNGALMYIEQWSKPYSYQLKIKKGRKTKLGDYKKSAKGHQITVNGDLQPDFFFFTFTHELAHLEVRGKFGTRIKPHGKEWKNKFSERLEESIHLYQEDFQIILKEFIKNPKANLFADKLLVDYYLKTHQPEKVRLNQVLDHEKFRIGKRIFKKEEKRKIRYLCVEIKTGKKYLINELAPIDEIY